MELEATAGEDVTPESSVSMMYLNVSPKQDTKKEEEQQRYHHWMAIKNVTPKATGWLDGLRNENAQKTDVPGARLGHTIC